MTYGPMTIERWVADGHTGKRVLIDGVDITNRCKFFDDTVGVAHCYVLAEPFDGEEVPSDDSGDPIVEVLTGTITVVETMQ